MNHTPPTLYEWAGGAEALGRLTEIFYGKVREDALLEPVFREMDRKHPQYVAMWLGEVFGGPPRYTEERGGYPHMMHKHLNRALTEEMRRRWVNLICRCCGRGWPAGRPRVPLGLRRLHRVGHAYRGRQLAAWCVAARAGARAALGLGRGAALQPGDVTHREAGGRRRLRLPARAGAALAARVEAQASHDHPHVPAVRIDRDPATGPRGTVVHEQT